MIDCRPMPGRWLAIACVLPLAACASQPAGPAADADELLARVDAGMVVAIADGDFLASTYADRRLAPDTSRFRDRLVVWQPGSGAGPARVEVPNSVTSPPEILAVSTEGRMAYVVERLGQRSGPDRHR